LLVVSGSSLLAFVPLLSTSPGTAVQFEGVRSALNSNRYRMFEIAVQVSCTFVPESKGVKRSGAAGGAFTPVTRTMTELLVLLNCIVTWFEGYEKLEKLLFLVPAVTTAKVSLVVGR
jgi:hypothetical protein